MNTYYVLMIIVILIYSLWCWGMSKRNKALSKKLNLELQKLKSNITETRQLIKNYEARSRSESQRIVNLLQMVCRHDGEYIYHATCNKNVYLNFINNTISSSGFDSGEKICAICNKVMKIYKDEAEYNKEKSEYDKQIERARLHEVIVRTTDNLKKATETINLLNKEHAPDNNKTVSALPADDQPK